MDAMNDGTSGHGTPGHKSVHVHGIAIAANGCKLFLISDDEVPFRDHAN
jgi:hypothetical protein